MEAGLDRRHFASGDQHDLVRLVPRLHDQLTLPDPLQGEARRDLAQDAEILELPQEWQLAQALGRDLDAAVGPWEKLTRTSSTG